MMRNAGAAYIDPGGGLIPNRVMDAPAKHGTLVWWPDPGRSKTLPLQ